MAERILIFIVAFSIGAICMIGTWERAAHRGIFEVGGVVYKTEVVRP